MTWGASKGTSELIARVSSNDPSLTSLHIFQGKQFGSQEAVEIAKALESNVHLSELYASGHELEPVALKALAEAIGKNKSLRTVCVGNSALGDEGTVLLVHGVAKSTTLQQLDLESKSVGVEGASAINTALSSGLALQTLLIARNPLGNTGGLTNRVLAGVAALSEGIAASQLQHLDLRDCSITSEGAEALAKAVAASKTLRILKLDENNLGSEGAAALAEAVARSPSLQELHISNTSIGDDGIAALAAALCGSQLRVLEANGCGVGPFGAQLLGASLSSKDNPLEVLKLRDNSIQDEGVEHLGAALATGSGLQDLDIGNNQIGIGAARVLQGSSRLKKLNMQNARLEIQGTVALANALAACTVTTLVELELSGCRIQKEGMLRLLQVLQGFAAPALEVLLLAGNPAVEDPDFAMQVDILSTSRTDLDLVWRGSCEAPPLAADGGPPQPADAPDWSIEQTT